ncbi:MAG: hypothetical protein JEZ04_15055 [Spirochaetales bacterium]|nr:hypothetical protein [Spirochaetales bacterium]
MKKLTKILFPALIISALVMSCGVFGATPTIDSFTASAATINAGESVTFTIKGSTKDPAVESDLVDYSGEIIITSSPGSYTETISVTAADADSFTKITALTFPSAGTFTITATLSAGSKAVDKTVTITVLDVKPWESAESGEPYTALKSTWITGYSISPAGDTDWFKFQATSSIYVIQWQDYFDYLSTRPSADVKVTVYNQNGTILGGPQDYGCYDDGESVSTYSTNDGIKVSTSAGNYTSGEYIYIKVEGFSTSSSGTYSLYIW